MLVDQSARDGCVVLALTGDLDTDAAPAVQRTLLTCLATQPDAVVCDLSGVGSIDPACATLFLAVAHRPDGAWPDSSLLLCRPRPAVAEVLDAHGALRALPVFGTLDQAIDHASSRPGFLRERLRLVPTLEAISTARWFAADVCRRWLLDGLAEAAQLAVTEIVTDVVLGGAGDGGSRLVDLRLELRAGGLVVIVQGGPEPAWCTLTP